MEKPTLEQFNLNNDLVTKFRVTDESLETQSSVVLWTGLFITFLVILYLNRTDLIIGALIAFFLATPIGVIIFGGLFAIYKIIFFKNHIYIKKQLELFSKETDSYNTNEYNNNVNIVADYGAVIEKCSGMVFGAPISLLPHSKNEIKNAIKFVLKNDYNKTEKDNKKYLNALIVSYGELSKYMPDEDAKIVNMGVPPHWVDLEKIDKDELQKIVANDHDYIKQNRLEEKIEKLRNKQKTEALTLSDEICDYIERINKNEK